MLNTILQNRCKPYHINASEAPKQPCYLSKSFILMLCALTSSQATALEIIQSPALTMNPNGTTPLAGVVQFETDIPTRVTAQISNGIESWTREFPQYMTQHELPILGLKPDSAYTVELIAIDEDNNHVTITPALQAVTSSLPADFPTITVSVSDPSRMEPGYTLIDKFLRDAVNPGSTPSPDYNLPSYSMILDTSGDVVWYSTLGSTNMTQLPNGNIRFNERSEIIDIDLLGNVKNTINLQAPRGVHHDIYTENPERILSLSNSEAEVYSYPASYTDSDLVSQSELIRDTPVVEFTPNGSFVNQWNLSDLLDPTRISYSSLFRTNGYADWSHANAVSYSPSDDSVIVSIRNQDAVVKFSRSTGALRWILANHSNWPLKLQPYLLNPAGINFEWQYQQHASKLTPSGNVLLFDNGLYRASPFDGTQVLPDAINYSRAVEYFVDEQNMEIQQTWEYKGHSGKQLFSRTRGDADWMKNTGNILMTYADVRFVSGASSDSIGMGASHTRIIEVEHTDEADEVFEVAIYNETPNSLILGYRSERIPDLYPLDTDSDGIPDYQDNCLYVANGPLITDSGNNSQLDTDADGLGNICDGDLNNDGLVNSTDLGLFKLAFLSLDTQPSFNPDADFNGDNTINSLDLGIMKTLFSQTPLTAGLTPEQ